MLMPLDSPGVLLLSRSGILESYFAQDTVWPSERQRRRLSSSYPQPVFVEEATHEPHVKIEGERISTNQTLH
jgi:hypothetical protein